MTKFTVMEDSGETPHGLLASNPNIMVGDTIEFDTNNQQGYELYEVILDETALNRKNLKLIDSYDLRMEQTAGGKKRKTHKRKTHKRKTHKRKTHKRKTHKRKTHKRKTHKK